MDFNGSPILSIMEKAASKAARGLLRDFGEVEKLQVSRKGLRDFVTAADLKAEEVILAHLRQARPDYAILSEEAGEIAGNSDYRWVVDPLDGTNNFLHSVPHFCISIALEKNTPKGPEVQAGLIFEPLVQQLFWAEKGKGAFHNGARMRVSSRKEMAEALIATGNTAFRGENPDYDRLSIELSRACMGLRCMGSAALDLAYVASGKLEAFWQIGLKQWDMAAGMLMVKEAGGIVRDMRMQGDPYVTSNIVASNATLAPQLDKLMAQAMRQAAA
ncbi:inositol monophosphatase [bacterium]|nr:inositol monophosphatase [bacterium]